MLGSLLAHADKKVRDQALESLADHVLSNDLDDLEWLKLWKGYWMSDKQKVQLHLAQKISHLIWTLNDSTKIIKFLKAYFITLIREWNGIDSKRLDKFYSLSRHFQREILKFSSKSQEIASEVRNLMQETILNFSNPKLPLGLLYHSTEALVEEMINVKNYDIEWIGLYYNIFTTKDSSLYNRLLEVFEKVFKEKFETKKILIELEELILEKESQLLDAKSLKNLIQKHKTRLEFKETQRKLNIIKKRKIDSASVEGSKKHQKKSVQWKTSLNDVKIFNKKVSISLPCSSQPKVNLKAPVRSILK